ncbi:hypothetical protein JWG45_15360 [Leptospira sp. 201903070]|uniref:Uncharacterized protein n=1 Tax=Leptospira ainlahdjerensis TaxID=2810033 RepID=A0ABS2UFG1_9LEPT|nr:hypothetical protein [Leptospira ainlahdjerensis]MBM9578524.1 hypothetical protein [Leptospira ainlahdjerensis]
MTFNSDKAINGSIILLRILIFTSWILLFTDCLRKTRPFETSRQSDTTADFRSEMKVTQVQSGTKDADPEKPIFKDGREVIATSREFDPNPDLLGIELEETDENEEFKEKKKNGPAKEIRDRNSQDAWKYSCIFLHPDCIKGCKRSLNLKSKYVQTSNSDLLAECVQNCTSNCTEYFEESRRRSRGSRSPHPRTR